MRYKARLNAKGVEMTDKTRGILLVLGFLTVAAGAVGCGGGNSNINSSSSGNSEVAQFTGTWMYTQSSVTFCRARARPTSRARCTAQQASGTRA